MRFQTGILFVGITLGLCLPGAPRAQICEPDEMPPPAVFADSLLLPSVDWDLHAFYPAEGTHLDQVSTSYYTLESEFTYFGLAADFDQTEATPPHYFLPFTWRDLDLMSFEWQEPEGWQILREPELRVGGIRVHDPAADAAPEDSVLVSPILQIYGEYTGSRDQVFSLQYRTGPRFLGDRVPSVLDPELDAWSASAHMIGGELWYDTEDLFIEIDGTRTITTEINWKELYSPDEEFAFAPGDKALSGKFVLYTTYERVAADSVRVIDTNIHCAHGFYPEDWDPESVPPAYGLYASFSPGPFLGGEFTFTYQLVAEDFAGYHVWRRVEGSSTGWVNLWQIEKGAERDKNYWWWIDGEYNENLPPYYGYDPATLTPIFGDTRTRMYLDFDIHNGFAYDYAVTTFDRGFRPSSGESDHYIKDSAPIDGLDEIAERIVFNWQQGETLKNLYAVPNPLRTGKSAIENPTYHNYPGDVVRFVGLTAGSSLKIYSLAGDLIAEKESDQLQGTNMIWDTTNQMGEPVASGVYIFRVTNLKNEVEYGRLVIIR